MDKVIVVGKVEYPDHSRPHQQDFVQFAGGYLDVSPRELTQAHLTYSRH